MQVRSGTYLNFWLSMSYSHLLNAVESGSVPIDSPDADGRTLLNAAVSQGLAVPTIQRILDAGVDPSQIDTSGMTSVHLALSRERKDIA